jgi:cytochrome P450
MVAIVHELIDNFIERGECDKDTEVHGVKIPKDALVMLRYHAGNRDPELFDQPDAIDINRDNANDHIAF